jgi:hypothetical protein
MSKFDIVDSHAYWNHPAFPGSGWDTRNYYVSNRCLVNAKDGGTLATLAKLRVFGKPYSVTEYDHPYPNQYSSEMMPMLAVMASLQDWDCIYSFCYELSQRNPQKQRITGYFDQASNPAKIAAMPFAARVFREFKTLDELEDSIAEQRAKMAARKAEQGDEVEINKKKK